MKLGHAIANFVAQLWDNDLEPWLKSLMQQVSHDVVSQLIPLAQSALQEAMVAGTTVSVSNLAVETAKKAAALSLQVAQHDLATAVAGVLAQAAAKQAAAS